MSVALVLRASPNEKSAGLGHISVWKVRAERTKDNRATMQTVGQVFNKETRGDQLERRMTTSVLPNGVGCVCRTLHRDVQEGSS